MVSRLFEVTKISRNLKFATSFEVASKNLECFSKGVAMADVHDKLVLAKMDDRLDLTSPFVENLFC